MAYLQVTFFTTLFYQEAFDARRRRFRHPGRPSPLSLLVCTLPLPESQLSMKKPQAHAFRRGHTNNCASDSVRRRDLACF